MNFFNNVKPGDVNQMINNFDKILNGVGLGDVAKKLTEEVKNVLKKFKIRGDNDVEKLLYLQGDIEYFLGTLKGCFSANKDVDEILGEIKKVFGNIKKEDLIAADSHAKIKEVLASSILFSGDRCENVEDIKNEGGNKLIFLFHGMGDNSADFHGAIQDTIKDFSVVSVEYNGSSLSNLDGFIDSLYGTYKGIIENFHNIYILGYSFGCLIANKFRSKLLEEFKDQDRKVHFIFYKGFYNILRCHVYSQVVDMLKCFNELYEAACEPNTGFDFLKDGASDKDLAEVTSNYELLSESRPVTMFGIQNVLTGHTVFGTGNSEITDALNEIEENIKNNPNINHVLFVSSENDEMVSYGGMMLYDALTRPQGSAVNGGGSDKSPDCCY